MSDPALGRSAVVRGRVLSGVRDAGGVLLTAAQYGGLACIAVATVIAGWQEVEVMLQQGKVTLPDLLLMFIFLEVLTMVGLYYKSGQLPVRFPLYIAMVALARYLILDMKHLDAMRIGAVAAGILVLAVAVLALRFGHSRYPDNEDEPVQAYRFRARDG